MVIRRMSGGYQIGSWSYNAHTRVWESIFSTSSHDEAFAVLSYLNGGAYPPMWNPPI